METGSLPPSENLHLKCIRKDKDSQEKEGFGIRFLLAVGIVGIHIFLLLHFHLHPSFITLSLLLFGFTFRPLTRRFYSDWVRKKDVVGEVIFTTKYIQVTQQDQLKSIDMSQIRTLRFQYNYIQGKQFSSKDILHNGIASLQCTNTSGETEEIKCLIENEKQLAGLKPILKAYYLMGIEIHETMGKYAIKTLLFDADLSYAKIQAYKKELQLTNRN